MPWKITSLVRARQQLVELMLARRQTIQTLCRRFNVSRKTAYKWRARFRQRGVLGLRDHSRRPRRSPRRLAATWVKVIRQWHRRRSHWGPKKIRHRLRQIFPRRCVPCARSIQRCLQRWQRGTPRPRRARKGPRLPTPGLTRPTRPNQVWTVDFKGWFRTADGQRQEPLTVRDLFSRFGLCVRLLPSQDDARVRQVFQRLFRQRGLPASIRADNGSPFAGTGALGLSRLSVWWLRLGIRVEFTRRARPGDNAAHEQFHGCYQRQVVATGGSHRRSMQPRSTRWLRDYNQDRPHEALNQRTPAEKCIGPVDGHIPECCHHWSIPKLGGCVGCATGDKSTGRDACGSSAGRLWDNASASSQRASNRGRSILENNSSANCTPRMQAVCALHIGNVRNL